MDEKDIWGVYKIIINECLNSNEPDMAFTKDEIVNYLKSQLGDDPSLALDILMEFNNVFWKISDVIWNKCVIDDYKYKTLEQVFIILLPKHNKNEIKTNIKDISKLCNEYNIDLALLKSIMNSIGHAINIIWDEIEFGDGCGIF